jgi:hypothetical protein
VGFNSFRSKLRADFEIPCKTNQKTLQIALVVSFFKLLFAHTLGEKCKVSILVDLEINVFRQEILQFSNGCQVFFVRFRRVES